MNTNYESTNDFPYQTFWYILIEGFSIVCVNCFILISGFFGIRFRIKSIFNILFTIFFWYIIIWYFYTLREDDLLKSFLNIIKDIKEIWFIWAYFGLILLSPLLNLFVENTTKGQLFYFLIIFFLIELICTIYPFPILHFTGGYSAESFMGLYLLASFYRKHYLKNEKIFNKGLGIGFYLGSVGISSLFFFLSTLYSNNVFLNDISYSLFAEYSSLLVILAAFGVLIYFSRLKFQSQFINWLGASAFSVYIIHTNPIVFPYFKLIAQWFYQSYPSLTWSLIVVLFSIAIYLGCTLLDQIRILIWNGLIKIFDLTRVSFKKTISSVT